MSEANKTQVGGGHYKNAPLEHWDVVALYNLDYFQGQITKYVMRWREKGGIQDLEKSQHITAKYIEVEKARAAGTLTRDLLLNALNKVLAFEQKGVELVEFREEPAPEPTAADEEGPVLNANHAPNQPMYDPGIWRTGPYDTRGEGTIPSTRS